jgi:hypothetical protein
MSGNSLKVLDLPYLITFYNEELHIFEAYWQKKDKEMSSSEFIYHLEEFAQLFEKYQVKGFYVDTRAYHIVMDLELQAWHDVNIVPKYIAGGVQKIAFVLPNEYIEALSIEQAFEEPQAKQLLVRHFDNETEAKAWISL